MKKLFKIVSVLFVLVVAVVVAGVAVLSQLDFNEYKGEVAAQVKRATGRDLAIAGDLKLDISFTPSLYVNGVSFQNAPWGSRPRMMTLDRLEAQVALLPLLSSEIDVKRLVLVGVDLLAETDAKGHGNWEFGAAGATPAPEAKGGATPLPVVRDVRVRDLALTYRDGVTKQETHLKLKSLDLAARSATDPLRLSLAGTINGQDFTATGTVGSVKQLVDGRNLDLDLRAEALAAGLSVKGGVGDTKALTGLNLTVAAKGGSLTATLAEAAKVAPQLAEVKVPDLGSFEASATVTGSKDKPSLTNIRAALGQGDPARFTVAGKVADPLKQAGLDLRLAADVKAPADLAKAAGVEIPALPPLKFAGHLSDVRGGYKLGEIALNLGRSDLAGDATVVLGGTRPRVSADLRSDLLDVDELLPQSDKSAQPPGKAGKDDGRVFPDDPLPVDAMKAADANIVFAGKKIRAKGLDITDTRVGVRLAAGRLDVKPVAAKASDGQLSAQAAVDGAGAPPRVDVDLKIAKLDYGKLLAALGQEKIASGTVDVSLKAKGAGTSVRAIMAGLDGKLRLVSEKGRIESSLLNVASADVLSALPLVDSKGDKDLRCAVVDFDIKKGLAESRAVVIETGGLSVVGVGGVNLRNETLNLAVEPRAKKASLLKATLVPVVLRGTLADPKVEVNPADLVTGAVGGVTRGAAAVVTFGLSIIAEQAFDRSSSVDETDYCTAALAGKVVRPAKGEKKSSGGAKGDQPPQQTAPAKEGIGGAVESIGKGLGSGLKGLFGK